MSDNGHSKIRYFVALGSAMGFASLVIFIYGNIEWSCIVVPAILDASFLCSGGTTPPPPTLPLSSSSPFPLTQESRGTCFDGNI